MRVECTRHCTFLILHVYTRKIDDIETRVQRTFVHTRRVHQARVHVRCAHAKAGLCAHWHV